jgi:flagella basal body P-ring formation protein FlgA
MRPRGLRRAALGLALGLLIAAPATSAGPASLEQRLADFVRSRAHDAAARIEVPPLPLSPGERTSLEASFSLHPRQRLAGRVPVRVALSRDGRPVRSLVVPVDVTATRRVLVAARPIRAGERIESDALRLEERSSAGLPRDALTDPTAAIGLRSRRHLSAGRALRSSRLELPTAVRRGQQVKLVLAAAGLRIESLGRAREDGNPGDWIQVQNLSSRRAVMARVGADGVLHVVP